MIVVDKKDMESLTDRDVQRLLLWSAVEILRRENDPYELENQISEAMLIHYGEDTQVSTRIEVYE